MPSFNEKIRLYYNIDEEKNYYYIYILMNEINNKIACILDIGEMLLSNGADVNRVEDTSFRLSSAFGFRNCHIHAINSSIILTLTTPEGDVVTQARRIKRIDTDLNKVSELNNLSREICGGMTDPEPIQNELLKIRDKTVYSPFLMYLAYAIAASFFTLFY